MQTECSAEPMRFARLERRDLVADFGGGAITSDAGALLLGATDRAIGLVDRFAACFFDGRDPGRVAHELPKLVGQRVFSIALGYEDLVDHDDVRRDPARFALLSHMLTKGFFIRLLLPLGWIWSPPKMGSLDRTATAA